MHNQQKNKRILLVEDSEKILRGNKRLLSWEGYTVDTATSIAAAKDCINANIPHIIILDIMLPDGNGIEFMKTLRRSHAASIPILLLTGLGSQEDMIKGLAEGSDDYMAKPYDFPVLLARIEALLRRSERVPDFVESGPLKLDITADIATLNGLDLLLSQKEFSTLLILVQNSGRYIGCEYLYERVWKMPYSENSNALKSTIKRLRSKLAGSNYLIEWSRDEGYIFSQI